MSINYSGISTISNHDEAHRIAERLLVMRKSLAPMHEKRRSSNLLLATWNLRDFGAGKFGMGHRLTESLYYIAEIMSCFDLVAVQEVNRNLAEFDELVDILGREEWDYIVTDATDGRSGNNERMAYLYNRDKVRFQRVAGEIVLPDGQQIAALDEPELEPLAGEPAVAAAKKPKLGLQFARTPFLVAFKSGWFSFNLCTVHIYFGAKSGAGLKRRTQEIARLVTYFATRQNNENEQLEVEARTLDPNAWPAPEDYQNYILLGDFNVVNPEHETMKALRSKGFTVPPSIEASALPEDQRHNFFDQIAVRVKDPRFETKAGGTIDIFADVFRPEDEPIYADIVKGLDIKDDDDPTPKTPQARYELWRTWQLSDHWPLWVEINTDFAGTFLEQVLVSD